MPLYYVKELAQIAAIHWHHVAITIKNRMAYSKLETELQLLLLLAEVSQWWQGGSKPLP